MMEHLPAWVDVVAPGLTPCACYEQVCRRYAPEREACRRAAAYVWENLPEAANALIAQADQFLEGRMILCGTMGKPFFVGNPPRWHDNPVGDAEYVFMLNRMEHWPVLLHAYYLTGNKAYAEKVAAELENWIDACPPLPISHDFAIAKPRFDAATPWRTLELGIRANRSWNLVLQLLSGEDCFPVALFEKMAMSLYEHGEILYEVCPVLWPKADHNHYLTECLGLLEITCLCDFLQAAPAWRRHALAELERCAQNQILPGGAQVEGAPTYHNECLVQLTYSIQLARRYGFAFSSEYEELVRTMLTRSLYTTRPNGVQVPWGDSDAAYLFPRSAFCHYRAFGEEYALALAASAFGEPGRQAMWEEFARQVWDLADAPATAALLRALPETPPALPLFHHDQPCKQVMARTGWDPAADSFFFSARSPIHNDHAHIDPNGFDYCSHGQAILPDGGRFTYREGGDRHYYKSTESHNTLTVNGRDAFAYKGTWAYGPQQEGGILAAGKRETFSYACGWHENYRPATHRRALIQTGQGEQSCLFVFDAVDGLAEQDLVSSYFLVDSTDAILSGHALRAVSPDGTLCTSLAFCGQDTAAVLAGRISESVDHERPARRLCLTAYGRTAQRLLTVICCREASAPADAADLTVQETAEAFLLQATVAGCRLCFAVNKTTWQISRLSC